MPTIMDTVDAAGEWRRLAEHYRQMSDGELLVLARQHSELTDVAQQALAQEMLHRKLKLPPEEPAAPPPRAPELDDSGYAEDRELLELCVVWSLRDALQVQRLLDTAGIPFFMGREKATDVDAVISNFVEGVSVQIMRVGLPWATQAMQNYEARDEPGPKREAEVRELSVRCPKCNSAEIIFERLAAGPGSTSDGRPSFEWTCDSCGHQWNDEGIADEE
jgi:DNA-directed RNA polymerase subunit M/transcription elongation factor TFIIS